MTKFQIGPTAKFFITPAIAPDFDGMKKHCVQFGRAKGGVQRCKKFRKGPGEPTCSGVRRKNMRVGRRDAGRGCRK